MTFRHVCAVASTLGVVVGIGLATGACGKELPAEGHVVLYVDTDAPIVAGDAARGAEAAPAIFDRLRVELFSPGSDEPCSSCVRDFDALTELFTGGGASVTVRGNVDRARVRLYRSADVLDGDVAADTTIESVVRMPRPTTDGAVELTVALDTDRVGLKSGALDAPGEPTSGRPARSRAGTWAPAQRVPCSGVPGPGEVCIPGGAYVMGRRALAPPDPAGLVGKRQRVVVVSPFFLDAREVTVGALRSWITATKAAPASVVTPWSGSTDRNDFESYCTYGRPEGDGIAVSCIGRAAALAFCRARGATLPTEAQFEYAAGALESRRHVWGDDPPRCADAVWGRDVSVKQCVGPPREGALGENEAPRERDHLDLPTGTVFDLAGNLSEITLDVPARDDEPCWSTPTSNVFVDPVCTTPSRDPALRTLMTARGGSWFSPGIGVQAAYRFAAEVSGLTGFRCARPDG